MATHEMVCTDRTDGGSVFACTAADKRFTRSGAIKGYVTDYDILGSSEAGAFIRIQNQLRSG